jgi:hypothetical protein
MCFDGLGLDEGGVTSDVEGLRPHSIGQLGLEELAAVAASCVAAGHQVSALCAACMHASMRVCVCVCVGTENGEYAKRS